MNNIKNIRYFLFQVHLLPESSTSFTSFFHIIHRDEVLPVAHSSTCFPALFYMLSCTLLLVFRIEPFFLPVRYGIKKLPLFLSEGGSLYLKMTIAFLYFADYTIP